MIVIPDTLAQGLERNLMTPVQIARRLYRRDRAIVVPLGSFSHTCHHYLIRCSRLAQHKALEDLVKAANV